MSESLQPLGLQHARLPCLSLSPRVCSNSCPLSLCCLPSISLCRPLLLPSVFPSMRVSFNESALHIRWPKYWSFSFNISPSNEHPWLISFRMDWLDLLAVQGTLKRLLQHHYPSTKHFFLLAQIKVFNPDNFYKIHFFSYSLLPHCIISVPS